MLSCLFVWTRVSWQCSPLVACRDWSNTCESTLTAPSTPAPCLPPSLSRSSPPWTSSWESAVLRKVSQCVHTIVIGLCSPEEGQSVCTHHCYRTLQSWGRSVCTHHCHRSLQSGGRSVSPICCLIQAWLLPFYPLWPSIIFTDLTTESSVQCWQTCEWKWKFGSLSGKTTLAPCWGPYLQDCHTHF